MPAADSRVELLTPRGAGGVAVLAVRGAGRMARAAAWLRDASGRPFEPTVVPRIASLWLDGEVVDECLVFDRPDVEVLEIHTHGSPAVLDAFGGALADDAGAVDAAERLARRALGDEQLGLALEQREWRPWGAFLERLAARPPKQRAAELAAIRARSVAARALAEPERLVLCGRQNAGKSTLMNRLLFRQRVLAGDLPGLTRDPVREHTVLGGYPYELVDTAGEGDVSHEVDQRALERARAEREGGAWRLLVVDVTRPLDDGSRALWNHRTLTVRNKADGDEVAVDELRPSVLVSCAAAADASMVRAAVGDALRELRELPAAGPVGGPAALDAEEQRLLDSVD